MFFTFLKRNLNNPIDRCDMGTDPEVTAALQRPPLLKRKTPPYPHVVTDSQPAKKHHETHK